jgi:hypothetical protein
LGAALKPLPAIFTILLSASVVQGTWAKDELTVNPYRPSISNPADLPPQGQLEFEFGGLREVRGDARESSLPYLFKLGLSKEWGVLLGGDARVWSRDEQGQREQGVGDTSLTLKRLFSVNDSTGLGLEVGVKAPTAKETIGIGKPEYTVNGIYSQDIGRLHADVNLNATRVGQPEPGTARMQSGLSAALESSFANDWTGVAELSGTHRKGVQNTAQILTAVVYSPGKRYSIDVGVAKGLNKASPDWSLFSGFVVPLGKLW